MLTIGAVSYLNTKPYIQGLNHLDTTKYKVVADYPSHIAEAFFKKEIDVALLPVAALSKLESYSIVAPYGIAADGTVDTVCLFAEMPIDELDTIYLDYQSKTSVMLMKLLCKKYLQINPQFLPLQESMLTDFPKEKCGILVIGDRAITMLGRKTYCYDLAALWKEYTHLPFIFALWVAHQPVDEDIAREFAKALEYGVDTIPHIIDNYASIYDTPYFSIATYLTHRIHFRLSEEHLEGMHLFLYMLREL